MANDVYTIAMQQLLDGNIDLNNGAITAVLVDATYTPDFDVDTTLADIPSGARVAVAVLAGKSVTSGVFDATDTVFTSVPSARTAVAVVLYQSSGIESTSNLIIYIDTGTGLPVTSTGADITVEWSNDQDRILRLAVA